MFLLILNYNFLTKSDLQCWKHKLTLLKKKVEEDAKATSKILSGALLSLNSSITVILIIFMMLIYSSYDELYSSSKG